MQGRRQGRGAEAWRGVRRTGHGGEPSLSRSVRGGGARRETLRARCVLDADLVRTVASPMPMGFFARALLRLTVACGFLAPALAASTAHAGGMDPTPERLVLQPMINGKPAPAGFCQAVAANPALATAGMPPDQVCVPPRQRRVQEPRLRARVRPRAEHHAQRAHDRLRRLRPLARRQLHAHQRGRRHARRPTVRSRSTGTPERRARPRLTEPTAPRTTAPTRSSASTR